MKYLPGIIMIMLLGLNIQAQDILPTNDVEIADPEAKATLDKLKTRFETFSSIEAEFTLTIEFPEEDPEIQKGKIAQVGDKYNLKLEDQRIISDGESLWYYIQKRNEVQINNIEEDEEGAMLSPKDFMKIYENESFYYAITNENIEKGKAIRQIEFKPKDDDSDYSKLRMTLDRKNLDIIRMKAFYKDGSRFTFAIDKFTPNKSFADSMFTFNKKDYPADLHIEDLRMD